MSLAPINEITLPPHSLHPCMLEIRVSSLDRAIKFFTEILAFKIVHHEECDAPHTNLSNEQSSPRSTRFSLTDVAPAVNSDFRFRLRFQYQAAIKPSINHSETGLRHVELQVPGGCSRAKVHGYKTNTEDGFPIVYGPDELPLLFNEMGNQATTPNSSSGIDMRSSPRHRRGSIDASSPSSSGAVLNPVVTLSFWTRDLDATYAFYTKTFGMKSVENDSRRSDSILLAFDDPQQPMLEFVQLSNGHELALSKDLQMRLAGLNRQTIDAVAQRAGVDAGETSVTVTDPDQRPLTVLEKSTLSANNQVIVDWKWRIKHGSGEDAAQYGTPRGSVRKVDDSVFDDNQFEAGGDNDKVDDLRLDRKRSV